MALIFRAINNNIVEEIKKIDFTMNSVRHLVELLGSQTPSFVLMAKRVYNATSHIYPVTRLESFRALTLSRLENFRALKPSDANGGFPHPKSLRVLKLSRLENFLTLKPKPLKEYFRALKLFWVGEF